MPAYNLGNLWRRLGLPNRIKSWSLTSLQHRLMKTGGRLVKHARYYWLLPAEGHLNRRLLRNSGRRPATNVRLAHPYLPDFNVFPSVGYRVENLPGGGREIVMPTLVPNEQVTISYLYFPPTTWKQINGPVKSDEGLARVLQVLPTEQYPMWFNRLAAGLILIGLIALVYVLFVIMGRLLV